MEEDTQDTGAVETDGYADAEPAVVEPSSPTDDSMYVLEEGNDPVSWADIKKGNLLNADYTQKTQGLADERRAFEAQQAQYQQELQHWMAQVKQQYEQQYRQAIQQQQPQGDPLEAIWAAADANGGLITKAEAQKLVEHVTSQQGQPNDMVVEAIRQLNSRVNQVSAPLSEMLNKRESEKLDSMVGNFLTDKNIPDEFHDQAREIFMDFYNANEPTQQEMASGQTMESMFSEFAGGRLEAMLKMADGITKAQAESAKANLGRQGGAAAPSNQLGAPMTTEEIMVRVDPQFPSR